MPRSVSNQSVKTRTQRLKQKLQQRIPTSIGEKLTLIYRRPLKGNGTWQVQYWHNNNHLKHKLAEADDYSDDNGDTVLTFYQAQESAKNWAKELLRPNTTSLKPVTIGDAAIYYMKWFKLNRKSIIDTERTINAHILPAFENKLIIELTALDVKQWLEKLAVMPPRRRTRKGMKQSYGNEAMTNDEKRSRKSTANRVFTVLKAILNKSFEDGLTPDDKEWRRVKPFKQTDEPITRFLTVSETKRLINACREDFRLLVQAALLTGCRYGELTRLLVSNFNLDTNLIYINSENKSAKGHHIPLSDEGHIFFEEQSIGKTGLDYIFKRQDGSIWLKNHQTRLLKTACKQAKIEPPIRFHELRHTYASLLAQAGADLLSISKLLGHADTRVTSRHYAHLCDKTLANTVKSLLPNFGHQSSTKIKQIK